MASEILRPLSLFPRTPARPCGTAPGPEHGIHGVTPFTLGLLLPLRDDDTLQTRSLDCAR
jgi:hypothetical protein